jgi:hypothetical protein
MSEIQPSHTDAILGKPITQPINSAVLGGIAGIKQRLTSEIGVTHEIFSFEIVSINDQADIIGRTKKQACYYTEDLGNSITLDIV